jgi:hypothetical protein
VIAPGQPFPNLFLVRPDSTSLELNDFKKREHCLILFVDHPHPDTFAFVRRFQDEARTFEWLQTRLIVVFSSRSDIPTPWPAPAFAPFIYSQPLPDGAEWGKAYLVSKHQTLFSIYPELPMLAASVVEKDILYWEARHC